MDAAREKLDAALSAMITAIVTAHDKMDWEAIPLPIPRQRGAPIAVAETAAYGDALDALIRAVIAELPCYQRIWALIEYGSVPDDDDAPVCGTCPTCTARAEGRTK